MKVSIEVPKRFLVIPPEQQTALLDKTRNYLVEQLRTISTNKTVPSKRKAGSAKGKIKIANDFDVPLNDFKEYME